MIGWLELVLQAVLTGAKAKLCSDWLNKLSAASVGELINQ